MIGWVSGPLSQDLMERLLVWRVPVWRWYLEVPVSAIQERPEVVRFLGDQEVWLWSTEPPTAEQAILAAHHSVDGWVWDSPQALPWSVDAVGSLGYTMNLELRTYVNASNGLPDGWVEWVTGTKVGVIPYWNPWPQSRGGLWLDSPGVEIPPGLVKDLAGGSNRRACKGVTCLHVREDRVVGCRWCGSAGTLAKEKREALAVLRSDVAHCGGCLTPWPYWDEDHRRAGPNDCV